MSMRKVLNLQLLIEPSGIEIQGSTSAKPKRIHLLIEPSGIEMIVVIVSNGVEIRLLIEPSGIEISGLLLATVWIKSFNRTIWN